MRHDVRDGLIEAIVGALFEEPGQVAVREQPGEAPFGVGQHDSARPAAVVPNRRVHVADRFVLTRDPQVGALPHAGVDRG